MALTDFWCGLDRVLSTVWGKILFAVASLASVFWIFTEPARREKRAIALRRAEDILAEIEQIHKSCLKDHVKVDAIHDCIHERMED